MQIQQGTMRESIHPLRLMSLAYQEKKAASSVA
jgi:hypothetical protein